MPDIFLSYSRDDLATARQFAQAFEREGLTVWWDQTLNPGEDFDAVTEAALHEARAVVVLWSKKSVSSRWVRAEATQAYESKTLVPVMIETCKRPIMFELTHTADLSNWKGNPDNAAWQSYLAGVRRLVGKDGSGCNTPSFVGTPASSPALRRSQPRVIAIVALALLVAGAGWWILTRRADDHVAAGPAAVTAPAASKVVRLAVLPFADLSTARDQESFSDGLTEELLNQLAQVRDLAVTGRTSSFSFKGRNEDLRTIASTLGVEKLLEGSIRKEGNSLRITAQLIDGSSGAHLWSQTYDRELASIFALQEEIARDVTRALSVTLDVGDLSRAKGGTTNIDALEKYFRAQATFERLDDSSAIEASRLYREATQLDPEFWRAWYALSDTLTVAQVAAPDHAQSVRRELATVRAHLIEAAPDSWEKQLLLAIHYFEQRKWGEYETASNAALAEVPQYSSSEAPLALFAARIAVGRVQEAVVQNERAVKLDPLSLGRSFALQVALDLAGRRDEAQAEYERSKGLAGSHLLTDGQALLRLMQHPDATPADIQDLFRSLAARDTEMAAGRPAFDTLGDPKAARATARQMLDDPAGQVPFVLMRTAAFADLAGDRETALAAMQRFADAIGRQALVQSSLWYLWAPYRTGLRADPRFKDIVRELGLVDYWRTTGNWGDFCRPVNDSDFACR